MNIGYALMDDGPYCQSIFGRVYPTREDCEDELLYIKRYEDEEGGVNLKIVEVHYD